MIPSQRRHFITVINQANVAYREFLGKNRVKLNPGLRLDLHSCKGHSIE